MATQLTPEQMQDYQNTFALFDKNGQGYITTKDLKRVLKKLGKSLTTKDLKTIIKRVDTDGNGKIDLNEFIGMMTTATRQDNEEAIRDSFRVFDQDGNGFISKAELRQVMATLGEKLSDEDALDMIKEADIDGDGQINYKEFVKMMFGK